MIPRTISLSPNFTPFILLMFVAGPRNSLSLFAHARLRVC